MTDIHEALRRAGATIHNDRKNLCCPFHDDKHPSGAIFQGHDGRWRFKCYACDWNNGKSWGDAKDVMKAAGLGVLIQTDERVRPMKPQDRPAPPNWRELLADMEHGKGLIPLATQLGVDIDVLESLGVRYHVGRGVWAIPMRDAQDQIIGLQLRYFDGRKFCWKGSRAGLFVDPAMQHEGFLVLCEGMSDTAAVMSCGVEALGRFAARSNPERVIDWLKHHPKRDLCLVADNDETGRTSATQLAKVIGRWVRSVRLIRPAHGKDVREWRPTRAALTATIWSAPVL